MATMTGNLTRANLSLKQSVNTLPCSRNNIISRQSSFFSTATESPCITQNVALYLSDLKYFKYVCHRKSGDTCILFPQTLILRRVRGGYARLTIHRHKPKSSTVFISMAGAYDRQKHEQNNKFIVTQLLIFHYKKTKKIRNAGIQLITFFQY